MAEEEKPKQLVQPGAVLASGITAIVAALFTSKLGVAGTLIGTALTPMLMTIGVAVLNAQIEKAASRLPDLPSTVRGRLSAPQRVRVPGTPGPEENPEQPESLATPRRRDRRTPGAFERLLSIPTYLREMSPSVRRRVLLTGVLTGLVAAVIGLVGVTGIETASGSSFSCTMWEKCGETTASGGETGQPRNSLAQALGGSSGNEETEGTPSGDEAQPADVQQPEARPVPDAEESPVNGQYEGTPQGDDGQVVPSEQPQEAAPAESLPQQEQPAVEEPGAVPQDGSQEPPVEQPVAPAAEQPAAPSGQEQ